MKLNIDHVLMGIAVALIGGGFLALSAHSSTQDEGLASNFTSSDKVSFDTNFKSANGQCDVGLAKHGICFEPSPLEQRIELGEPFPENMFPLAIEWRAGLALDQKAPDLKTVRVGQTLILMDRETRTVIDMLDVGPQQNAETEAVTAG